MKTKNLINIAILGIILLLIITAIFYLESKKAKPAGDGKPVNAPTQDDVNDANGVKAPELTGISGYINTKGLKLADLRGKVVLVDFWTYSCINCIRTLPYLTEWDRKYKDKGLVIVGVHTPEFDFEKDYDNLLEAVNKYGIKYPVVQDNDYATWRAYGNRFWPHKYLIDANGIIRYDHIGEGGYKETEMNIQELLSETGAEAEMPTVEEASKKITGRITPELYVGYEYALPRGQNVGNVGGVKPDETEDYKLPSQIKNDVVNLEGEWQSNSDNLRMQGEQGSIVLDYTASEVNIVADSVNGPIKLYVYIDDQPIPEEMYGLDVSDGYILIDKPQLYNVVKGDYDNHVLKLTTYSKNFEFNAFTFG